MQDELVTGYLESLEKRLQRVESLLSKIREGNTRAEENIRLLAHSLHGSGATFGFPEISEASSAVEHADIAELPEKLSVLKEVLEKTLSDNADRLGQSGDKTEEQSGADGGDSEPAPPEVEVRDSPAPAGEKVVAPSTSSALRILVVDDDKEIVNMVTETLKGLPGEKQVTVVGNAAKTQEAIVKNQYDLIIMDLMLPDRDGRELIHQVKLDFQIKTPLLVLSGIHKDEVRVECMSLGADKYLTKPFLEQELLKEAKSLLSKKIQKKLTLVPKDGEVVEDDEDEEEADKPRVLTGKIVLVADDDKQIGNAVRQQLLSEGATVEQAFNGREAMQILRSHKFDLIILDVKMPVMDGFEVLERIKQELKLETPVIMLTAMGSEDDIIRGYDIGATDYILKPFSEIQLRARVKSLLKS